MGAWWVAAAVGLYFSFIESGQIVALVWTAACIAFPFLWNVQQRVLRLSVRVVMAVLALLSLIALISIAADGTWDIHDRIAFAFAALTIVATATTFFAIMRGGSARSAPAVSATQPPSHAMNTSLGSSMQVPHGPSPKIFISYRRDDSQAVTDRLFDHLASVFPRENLFRDIDSIPRGSDFRRTIERNVSDCDVLLAIIGPQWLGVVDENGRSRLENPADVVRLEIEAALRREIPVIPVLLSKVRMPKPDELPESLRELAYRNGADLRHDPDFHADVRRLVEDLGGITARAG
jgi:hypothetical protein